MAQRAEGSHKGSNAKSVSKTLEILSTFNELAPEQRTSDIANKLHMNISTVSRHLNTMLDWNFLERDDSTGYYSLGLEIVALAGAALAALLAGIGSANCNSCLISTASTAIWECPVQWMWYI